MKVYIAGKMRGVPHYNYPAFDHAANVLRAGGHEPVSPADLDRAVGLNPFTFPPGWDWGKVPDGFDMRDALDRDIAALKSCDAIFMLPGWETSKGATAEYHIARWLGLAVLNVDTESLLEQADRITNADRNRDYGHPKDDFERAAFVLTGALLPKLKDGEQITAADIPRIMVGVKLARLANHPNHRDSWVDVAGYAATWDRLDSAKGGK